MLLEVRTTFTSSNKRLEKPSGLCWQMLIPIIIVVASSPVLFVQHSTARFVLFRSPIFRFVKVNRKFLKLYLFKFNVSLLNRQFEHIALMLQLSGSSASYSRTSSSSDFSYLFGTT